MGDGRAINASHGTPHAVILGMSEQADRLKARTMRFAIDVCALVRTLPREEPGSTVARQLTKAGTSTAANYRAACRARSHAEFTAKIGLVNEEADESLFWLEFIEGTGLTAAPDLGRLRQEAFELVAIFARAVGTARLNERQR
jgi:four helix bundle protein